MVYTSIIFENPNTDAVKETPVGVSWTTLFFGFLPALFRGDWKWAVIMLILAIITFGLSGFVFMFIYNKIYIKNLIRAGFKAKSLITEDLDFLELKLGIKIPKLDSK